VVRVLASPIVAFMMFCFCGICVHWWNELLLHAAASTGAPLPSTPEHFTKGLCLYLFLMPTEVCDLYLYLLPTCCSGLRQRHQILVPRPPRGPLEGCTAAGAGAVLSHLCHQRSRCSSRGSA
jgi:hypothetical protein